MSAPTDAEWAAWAKRVARHSVQWVDGRAIDAWDIYHRDDLEGLIDLAQREADHEAAQADEAAAAAKEGEA